MHIEQDKMSEHSDTELLIELSKFLTFEELERLKRTNAFFQNNKSLSNKNIARKYGLPVCYIEEIEIGTIIPEEDILKLLEN